MIRRDLIEGLCQENPNIARQDVAKAVVAFFDRITTQMGNGGRVELRGFGAFFVKERRSRSGRNPLTGAPYTKPPCSVPRFRASPLLARELISPKQCDADR